MQLNMWNFNTLLLNGFLHDHPINQIVQICHWIKKINLLCGQSPTKWRTSMRWNPLAYSESTFKNENGFGSMWFIDVLLDLEIGHQYLLVEALIYTLLQWYQGKKNHWKCFTNDIDQFQLIFMTSLGRFHVSHFNNTETL